MFRQIELTRDVPVGQTLGHQLHQLFLSFGQQFCTIGVFDGPRPVSSHKLNDKAQLVASSPNLPPADCMDALA